MSCYRRILCRPGRVSRFAAWFGVCMSGGLRNSLHHAAYTQNSNFGRHCATWARQAQVASLDEVLAFIEREKLFGLGCEFVGRVVR